MKVTDKSNCSIDEVMLTEMIFNRAEFINANFGLSTSLGIEVGTYDAQGFPWSMETISCFKNLKDSMEKDVIKILFGKIEFNEDEDELEGEEDLEELNNNLTL